MKFKFNSQVIHRFAKSLATLGALFTMVMSPVAMGREAQKITVKQLQDGLTQMGLNKQTTFGEFYAKNKNLFPERVQKELEPFIANYKNQLMPTFEVVSMKGTDGTDVAVMRATRGNELVSVQMLGGEDRFAKVQNTFVSEVDVINFNDMFRRVLSGDEKYRKQYEASLLSAAPVRQKPSASGFPDLTVATWKGMSQKERAGYIVNMRLLWIDARRVLIEAEKKNTGAGRKTSSVDSTLEKWDHFFAMLAQPAEAMGADPRKPKTQVKDVEKKSSREWVGKIGKEVKKGAGSNAFVSGSNCIVAGYVSKYTSSKCGIGSIFESYTDRESGGVDKLVQSANQACSSGTQIACNPYVYGTPGGKPICVSTSDSRFQQATHYDGPCDEQSRLGSNVNFLKKDLQNSKRYSAENRLLTDAELDAKYKEEQKANPKYVEDFLNGLLAYNNSAGIDFSKPLTDESLQAVLNIKRAFDNDIKKAKESCELAAANKSNEKNFWGACDQLHRRHLNVAQFLETTPGCKDGSKINPDSLKCLCPSGTEALPGTSCNSPQPPPPGDVDPTKPPAAGANCEEQFPGATGLDAQCKCADGASPKLSTEYNDIKHYTCGPVDKPGGKKEKEDCGFFCKLGKGIKDNILLIAGSAIAIFAAYKLLTPKKPKLKSPADLCLNGTTAPCVAACTNVYQVRINGTCQCAECPAGQTISNASTCACSTSTTTTTYTCADGVTQVTDLASCPATTYTCWDGSTVTNALNCPEKPSTTNSSPTKSKK